MHMLLCYFYRKPNEVQISASLNAMKFQKHTSLPHPIHYRMPKFSCYAGYKLAEGILRKLPQWVLEISFVVVFSNRFHPRHFEKAFWSHGVRRSKRIFFLCVWQQGKIYKAHLKDGKTQSNSFQNYQKLDNFDVKLRIN